MENKIKIEKVEPKLGLSHAKLILNMTGKFKIQLVEGKVKITDYFRFSEKSASCFLDRLKKDEYVIKNMRTNENISKIRAVETGRVNSKSSNYNIIGTVPNTGKSSIRDFNDNKINLEQDKSSVISKFKSLFKK